MKCLYPQLGMSVTPVCSKVANATSIDYASRLWQVFRAVIAGALDEMTILIEDRASEVMGAIERHAQALRASPAT